MMLPVFRGIEAPARRQPLGGAPGWGLKRHLHRQPRRPRARTHQERDLRARTTASAGHQPKITRACWAAANADPTARRIGTHRTITLPKEFPWNAHVWSSSRRSQTRLVGRNRLALRAQGPAPGGDENVASRPRGAHALAEHLEKPFYPTLEEVHPVGARRGAGHRGRARLDVVRGIDGRDPFPERRRRKSMAGLRAAPTENLVTARTSRQRRARIKLWFGKLILVSVRQKS